MTPPLLPCWDRSAARPPADPTDVPSESENSPMPEQELNDVFQRAVGDAAPDLGLLVAGATARGRSIRLRRRAALLGTVLTVAGLALGGGLLLRPAPPAPAVAPAAAGSVAPVPSPQPTLPPGWAPMNGTRTRAMLEKLLSPELTIDTWNGRRATSDTQVQTVFLARLRSLGDQRTGTFEIQVSFPTGRTQPPFDRLDCTTNPADENCRPLTGGKGDTGVAFTRYDEAGQISYVTKLRQADGVLITLIAVGTDGDEPLVSLSSLMKWVTGPDWPTFIAQENAETPAPQPEPGPDRTSTGRPTAAVSHLPLGAHPGTPLGGTSQ
ncbi:hypothetical protein ACIQF6_13710 [Kitasatospora sp. NPDC092948]|uniref:hypothetical protein n=1 Tax=Kitasatospora sp. NPDC092948 TaxID=3364088 RepID=UPI003810AAA9